MGERRRGGDGVTGRGGEGERVLSGRLFRVY
jgi:hypothetical protein